MKKETELVLLNLEKRLNNRIALELNEAFNLLLDCYKNGNKIIIAGNGGSASDSLHLVGELMKSFISKRKLKEPLNKKLSSLYPEFSDYYYENLELSIPAISLVNDIALTTAFSNDKSSDLIFAQQILGISKPGDVVLLFSTSGNSSNILHALRICLALDLKTIGMTGNTGGKMLTMCNVLIKSNFTETYRVQEEHIIIYHALARMLEIEIFGIN